MGVRPKRQHAASGGIGRLLAEDTTEAMLVIDGETLAILDANRAAAEKYGYSGEELRRMRLTSLISSEDRMHFDETLRRDERAAPDFFDIRHVLKNGKSIEVDMLMHRIQYGGKKAMLVVPQDATRRHHLEEQLRQAQKMEAVGMLAGGIAHDFNNLLTIINGYSQMVLGNLPEGDDNRNSVEQIMKAGERAAELTHQLLTFSRRQVVRPKVLDLNTVVTATAVMLRRLIGEHIELRIVVGPHLAKIHADAGQLHQVILNLAVNSRDAMPNGGTLILETQNVELGEAYGGANATIRPGHYVMLAVTDTGIGMDEQTRSRLFEPFFTTKSQGQGTGLGLSTVYGIVKQSNCEIVVYSEPGHGTCVKIYFPVVTEEPVEDTLESLRSQVLSGTETILLVEDDEAVRRLVRRTLEKQGYQLLVAASGTEALEIVQGHPGRIHLVISDVVMPQMGGRQLAERLQALRPKIRVLFVSGYTENSILSRGNLVEGEAFLQKPFTPLALARRVRELLDMAEGELGSHKTEGSTNS
ncbi:MAG TPA: response regulator [Bryobacteraceae bacterium]|nr:response regulator [Bryobacteraceae bacterium]